MNPCQSAARVTTKGNDPNAQKLSFFIQIHTQEWIRLEKESERLRDAHLIRQEGSIRRKKINKYQTAAQVVAGEKNQRTDREG